MPTIEPEYAVGLHRDDGTDALFTGRLEMDAWGYLVAFGIPKHDAPDMRLAAIWSASLKTDAERVAKLIAEHSFPGRLTTTIVEIRRGA